MTCGLCCGGKTAATQTDFIGNKNHRDPQMGRGDASVAPERTRTSTPCRAQALNLLRMPIPPPGLARILYSDVATCQTRTCQALLEVPGTFG